MCDDRVSCFLEDCLIPPLAATFTVDSSWRRSITVKSQLRAI